MGAVGVTGVLFGFGDGVAGAGDALAGAAGAGGTGMTEPPLNGLFVAVDGSDAAAGTLADPFATLAHAASVAQAGDTIVLLDGEHLVSVPANAPIVLLDAVNLMALDAGQATVAAQGTSSLLELAGTHRISGLAFENFQNVVRFAAAAVSPELTVVDTSFKGCGDTCIEATGAAQVQIEAEPNAVLGNGNGRFVVASGTSQVRIDGGVLQNFGRNIATADAAVEALGEAVVELTNLRVETGVALAFSARDQATLNAKNVISATLGRGVMWLGGSAAVTFLDSDLSLDASVQNPSACFTQTMDDLGSLWLERTKVHQCESAIYGWIPGQLDIIDSQLYDHKVYGMDGSGSAGVVNISGSTFSNCGLVCLRLGPSTSNIELLVRDSTFTAPDVLSVGAAALQVAASPSSTLDLGTLADPGGNTITGQSSSSPGLRLHSSQGGILTAVGNTWVAGEQGADGAGKYAVVTGTTRDITGPAAAGVNYGVSFAGAVLRIAEEAP